MLFAFNFMCILYIKDMFKYYNFLENDFTMSDIPLIKVIYEKLKKNLKPGNPCNIKVFQAYEGI